MRRDLVVIGASAGGIPALRTVLAQLPPGFPAGVLVVLHMAPVPDSRLDEILASVTALPVAWATDGDPIVPGQIVVARPDHHLLIGDGRVVLDSGPRENSCRPSINRTFRTAAAGYGARAIAVLLTGLLTDGVDGLRAIKRAGGVTIAQSPDEAEAPDLPRAAVDAGVVDRVVRLAELGPLLVELLRPDDVVATPIPADLVTEAAMDFGTRPDPKLMPALGPQTTVSCPDCGGPMWAGGDDRVRTFRCYLGHAHDAQDLLIRESVEVERALWTAVRSLHDRAATLDVLARDSQRGGNDRAAVQFGDRAREARDQADLAREFLLKLQNVRDAGG